MKFKFILIQTALIISNGHAIEHKAIYGNDNRLNLFEIEDQRIIQAARASAIMVKSDKLNSSGNEYLIDQVLLGERLPLCPEEDFTMEPSVGDCSGFLIAPDLILTAGHCVGSKYDCRKAKWVFDYSYLTALKNLDRIPKDNVYGCKRIIDKEENSMTAMDFSLIQLDRRVNDRSPLKLSFESRISEGIELILIGNPAGGPTKVAADAYVSESKHENYFVADTDSFQGSSGSAVLNANTLKVEGILVRGEQDYIPDHQRKCLNVNKCRYIEECRGEDIIRINAISTLRGYL